MATLTTSRASFWVITSLVLLLILLSGANLWLLWQGGQSGAPTPFTPRAALPASEPIFVPVGSMTVNLQDDSFGQRLLYTGFSLKVNDNATREILLTHMPEVRSRLLLLLSQKSADQLTAAGGKETLVEEITALLAEPLAQGLPPVVLNSVLFTDFIVQ